MNRKYFHTGFALIAILLLLSTSAFGRLQATKKTGTLTVPQILAKVRNAVGYDKIKKLKRGFAVEEKQDLTDSADITIKMFGPIGQVRRESKPQGTNTLVFDGKELWMINRLESSARYGSPAPANQKQVEKLVLQWWVESGWWLNDSAPLDIAVLPGESTETRVALSVKFRNGVVGSKLFIDRATWLPATLVVEQAKGPYTLELKDYQKTLGFLYPHRSTVNYDNSKKEYKIKSVAELPPTANIFRSLPPTGDTTFDNTVPAELKMAEGAPFPDGSKGHPTYVRPLIDGRDVGWFHFDTGADAMMIDNRIADELHMRIIAESKVVGADGAARSVTIRRGKTFQLGRVTIKNPTYVAGDLSKMNAPPGERRAGFCGYPLLARVVVEVNGGGQSIALYDPSTYSLSKGDWQDLSLINFTPAITAYLEGNREGLFMLDTGASGTVYINSKFSADEKLLEGRKTVEETVSSSGGDFKNARGSLEWFELAGFRFNNPKVLFRVAGVGYEAEGVTGVIGRVFMKPFTIVFNYPERRVAFIRHDQSQ
jgi:outer membrane lipoprotein-sorting protein